MKELELEILYNTEDTARLEELGIDVATEDYEYHNHIFYRIDAIAPCTFNKNWTKIYVNGDHFITTVSYLGLRNLIRDTLIN